MPRVGEVGVRPDATVRPTAVGSYIFAGGMTLGTVQAGFDVLCHLEESDYGVATARKNMSWLPVHVGPDSWPLDDLRRRGVDYVYGNPPCAAWSNAGAATKKGRSWDSSGLVDCTRRHFRTMEVLRPRVWAWESVRRAWQIGRDFVVSLAGRAAELGYSTTVLLHDARYLGVPQARPRMFVVCHRVEFEPVEPTWTETTIEEALAQVPASQRGEPLDRNVRKVAGMVKMMRQGENLAALWMRLTPEEKRERNDRGFMKGRPAFTIKRARSGRPAPVVMHELVHPTEHRALSVRELAHLCGYPLWYEFVGARDAGQIGRGVCPPVAEWLARAARHACSAGRDVVRPELRLVDYGTPPGRAELVPYATDGEARVSVRVGVAVVPDANQASATTAAVEAALDTSLPAEVETVYSEVRAFAPESPSPPSRKTGSGARIRQLLVEGELSHPQIVETVHREFPGSKATVADVRWHLNKIRKGGATGQPRPAQLPVPIVHRSPAVATSTPDDWRDRFVNALAQVGSSLDGQLASGREVVRPDGHVPQPVRTQFRQGTDPDREFDRTSLRAGSHGKWVHRDYGAHFFRWGFAARFVSQETEVLDVGCGPDVMMVEVLTMPRSSVPRRYVGVDMNREPRKHPTRQWATLLWEFDFTRRHAELGRFDLVTCFEVVEHMRKVDGDRLLAAIRACLKDDGLALVSTPVFDGKAAANHIHEWTVDELDASARAAGLRVERRFGTFARQRDVVKVATPAELEVYRRLSEYYSGEVMACFLAPLYPDASRNNVWLLRRDR